MTTNESSAIYMNGPATSDDVPGLSLDMIHRVKSFHQQLPDYNETPLISLPEIASELDVGHVLVKDESLRFGLPSFKILGASWAVYRAVAAHVALSETVALAELGVAARAKGVRLVACTDGNWGRAVSRMAKILDIKAKIFVPKTMDGATQDKIRGEGAELVVVQDDYDQAVKIAELDAVGDGNPIHVQDTAWPGYEDIPAWVVEGYSTMLTEADSQVEKVTGRAVDLAIASAGVGSFAQAVTTHYKQQKPSPTRVVAVEPTAASCVRASLEAGKIVPIRTGETIMDGMNCGTVSSIAWPVLQRGLDACVSVTDLESHRALESMRDAGMRAGPCGAAPLAALRKLRQAGLLELASDSTVILFCTEGWRPYRRPK